MPPIQYSRRHETCQADRLDGDRLLDRWQVPGSLQCRRPVSCLAVTDPRPLTADAFRRLHDADELHLGTTASKWHWQPATPSFELYAPCAATDSDSRVSTLEVEWHVNKKI